MKNKAKIGIAASAILVCILLFVFAIRQEHNCNRQMSFANQDVGLKVESAPSSIQGVTNKFVRLEFKKGGNEEWVCASLNMGVLSYEFREELIKAHQKLVKAKLKDSERGKYVSLYVQMWFPDDFPFLLRQMLILLVMSNNLGVETIAQDRRGLLVSQLSRALVVGGAPARSLSEHMYGIGEEYMRRTKDGGCVVSIVDMTQDALQPLRTYTIKTVSDYRVVAQETIALNASDVAGVISWRWGDEECFEDVKLVTLNKPGDIGESRDMVDTTGK